MANTSADKQRNVWLSLSLWLLLAGAIAVLSHLPGWLAVGLLVAGAILGLVAALIAAVQFFRL